MEQGISKGKPVDLFDAGDHSHHEPLAARMRPRTLDEYVGQDHIIGPGRLLRRAIQADQLTSVIFYGPPGTGKTTLARVIANHTLSNFVTLNAVLTGVQHIRDSIAAAEEQRKLYQRRTILFVDEVHRWNKAQQDALLPWVENGTIILIGATTENPFFEVNKALVSRSRVFQLLSLTKDDLYKAALNAVSDKERGYGKWRVTFTEGALEHLVETAAGDARSLLNALELAVETSVPSWPPELGAAITIDKTIAEESIQKKAVLYDRDGDYHYDVISAFIKSLRGRDPDAALYWMARMIAAGEDPHFIFRRMLISACEDTGLADPQAISIVVACAEAFDRVGLPEGQYHLAHAALYLSTAPKSNSSLAYFDALTSVQKEDTEVPNHLKDASRDAEGFGHGKGYIYPHSYREHWAAQQYLPDALTGRVFYTPSVQGYEGTIREDILTKRELQIAAILEQRESAAPTGEQLTFSPPKNRRDEWVRRAESERENTLLDIRNTLIDTAGLLRHHRALVYGADDGLLVWEAGRKVPEGFTAGLCRRVDSAGILLQYSETLDELDRPMLKTIPDGTENIPEFECQFDAILARDPAFSAEGILSFLAAMKPLLAATGRIAFSVRVPSQGMRLSKILQGNPQFTANEYAEAEESVFSSIASPLYGWNDSGLIHELQGAGWKIKAFSREYAEKRKIGNQELDKWFSEQESQYAKTLVTLLGKEKFDAFRRAIETAVTLDSVKWEYTVLFCAVTA